METKKGEKFSRNIIINARPEEIYEEPSNRFLHLTRELRNWEKEETKFSNANARSEKVYEDLEVVS